MAAPVSANTAATTALEAADAACTVSDGGQGGGAYYLQPWRRSVDVLEGMRWRRPLAATSSWQPQQRPRLALLAPRTRTHTGVLGDRQRAVGRLTPGGCGKGASGRGRGLSAGRHPPRLGRGYAARRQRGRRGHHGGRRRGGQRRRPPVDGDRS